MALADGQCENESKILALWGNLEYCNWNLNTVIETCKFTYPAVTKSQGGFYELRWNNVKALGNPNNEYPRSQRQTVRANSNRLDFSQPLMRIGSCSSNSIWQADQVHSQKGSSTGCYPAKSSMNVSYSR